MSLKLHPVARLTNEPAVKTEILKAKAALREHELFLLERADALDPQAAAERIQRSVSADMTPEELSAALEKINMLLSPAAQTTARMLKDQIAQRYETVGTAIENLLQTAIEAARNHEAEAVNAEAAFFAQYAIAAERTALSRRYTRARVELETMLAEWQAPRHNPLLPAQRHMAGQVPVPLRWFGVNDLV